MMQTQKGHIRRYGLYCFLERETILSEALRQGRNNWTGMSSASQQFPLWYRGNRPGIETSAVAEERPITATDGTNNYYLARISLRIT